jgi:cytochrome c-type biogenesis protein CcsB
MSASTEIILQRESIAIVWELRAIWVMVFLYFLSALYYLIWLFLPGSRIGKLASGLFMAAALIHTGVIVFRTLGTGRLPYQTLYESLLWFAWSAAITHVFVARRCKGVYASGFPVAVMACAGCLYAVLGRSPAVVPMFPALQSDWFIWHMVIAFMSYAVFLVAFSVEFGHVILTGLLPPSMLPRFGIDAESAARFHRLSHQLVLFGFPLLTFGIVSGAAWAEQAWGRYWSWGPKETWSLITWVVYALYLHSMTMAKWRGARASAINILGFACTLMTVLGVSWIAKLLGIPSLHAYMV